MCIERHGVSFQSICLRIRNIKSQALGTSETEDASELLRELAESKDQDILEAACESLKKVGDDHNTTELLRILQTIPEENDP
mgnify:CR=1 FL=1